MRVIARLDVKNEHVIKGIHLEGLRKVGKPNDLARDYYAQGIDEIMFIDSVASLYGRNNLFPVIRKASEDVFVPITIGGGIRSVDDVAQALDSGADKVAINTAGVHNPKLIEDVAQEVWQSVRRRLHPDQEGSGRLGSLCRCGPRKDRLAGAGMGRRLVELGAGEMIVTSIDREGTKSGFDIEVAQAINEMVNIPVVISGGYGQPKHIGELLKHTQPSGLCFASVLHYKTDTVAHLRTVLREADARA